MIIFIAGVHGVGKSFLCKKYATKHNILHKSASQLIKEFDSNSVSVNKQTKDINKNQEILIQAVNSIHEQNKSMLLDGHFILINTAGNLTSIDALVFKNLNIDGIVLIENFPNIIEARLSDRDRGQVSYDIKRMLALEKEQALFVANLYSIPIEILFSPAEKDFEEAISRLKKQDYKLSC